MAENVVVSGRDCASEPPYFRPYGTGITRNNGAGEGGRGAGVVEDTAAGIDGDITADGVVVQHDYTLFVIVDTAATGLGGVTADGAVIQGGRAAVGDTAAVASCITANGAVIQGERTVVVVDTTASVIGGCITANGAVVQDDCAVAVIDTAARRIWLVSPNISFRGKFSVTL